MPPLPADSIHARACKLKCEKILTRPYVLKYERIAKRRGKKRAIIAIARMILTAV